MFAYCGNNPINTADHSGNKPGELFDTPDEAALDFANCYNATSIDKMQEYGSAIYEVQLIEFVFEPTPWYLWIFGIRQTKKAKIITKYSYTKPSVGRKGNTVTPNFLTLHKVVSTVHTHANYDSKYGAGNDNFSDGIFSDMWWANTFKMDMYVATPSGYLKKYTYAHRNDKNGGVTIISTDIPYDPNSPHR